MDKGIILTVGIEICRVGVAFGVCGDEAARVGIIETTAKVNESCFWVVALRTETPRKGRLAFSKGGEVLLTGKFIGRS